MKDASLDRLGCIAAIARRHNLTIATGTIATGKDFQRPGIKVFNPFESD